MDFTYLPFYSLYKRNKYFMIKLQECHVSFYSHAFELSVLRKQSNQTKKCKQGISFIRENNLTLKQIKDNSITFSLYYVPTSKREAN